MMLGVAALVLLMARCSVSLMCPDGKYCPDPSTCCKTEHGYGCCPYPHAVCCPDLSHCCPEGFQCNMQTQMCEKSELQAEVPMLTMAEAEEPSIPLVALGGASAEGDTAGSLVVRCDGTYACPDGTTCCHHPAGGWSCCIYSPAQCCLDGYHCCPHGYQCDWTYTHCLKRGVPYPFLLHKPAATVKPTKAPVVPRMSLEDECCLHGQGACPAGIQCMEKGLSAEGKELQAQTALSPALSGRPQSSVIICDLRFFCPDGNTCCQGPTGQWGCCPYPLGQCCQDGKHCCEYGFRCDCTSLKCTKGYLQFPSAHREAQPF